MAEVDQVLDHGNKDRSDLEDVLLADILKLRVVDGKASDFVGATQGGVDLVLGGITDGATGEDSVGRGTANVSSGSSAHMVRWSLQTQIFYQWIATVHCTMVHRTLSSCDPTHGNAGVMQS